MKPSDYMWHVYIVKCADDTLYTGITTDVGRRVKEHNSDLAGAKYTRTRRPVEPVYSRRYKTRSAAAREEWRIKALPRTEKINIIRSVHR